MNIPRLATLLLGATLCLPALAQPPSATTTARGATTTAPSTATPAASQSKLLDINSVSIEQLDTLPGIGKARAEAIIKNRPYRAKNELASRHIIPQSVYDQIKDKIVARQG
ncbi:MAG: helix-hairpin-helix domain-containing protein [Rhodospirillales bacterium]|nr:helix-hairpin-helix domain-containing protein [Rhodospirillales bacterium]